MKLSINKLTPKKWKEFREIRLHALKTEPMAFGNSYDRLLEKSDDFWMSDLSSKYQVWYGAFLDKKLVAIISVKYPTLKKFKHIIKFSGLYVDDNCRGRGLGKALFESRINEAFLNKNITKIKLIVNKTQTSAVNLYSSFGFKKVGNLLKEFKINGNFYDAFLMELLR